MFIHPVLSIEIKSIKSSALHHWSDKGGCEAGDAST